MTSQQIVEAYIAAQAALRARAGAAMAARWVSLPAYNKADVPGFLALAVPLTIATQRASIAITSAFLARRLDVPQIGVDPADVVIRNGVDPAEVYARPFVNVWSALKDGKPYADAVASGAARAESAVQMDAQLTMRETLRVVGQQEKRIVGYRRVPDAGACVLCLMASTQRYHTGQLMPIHNHCGCGVDVILGTEDPGRVIDKELLRELKQSGQAGDLSYQQATYRARKRAAANHERADEVRKELTGEADPKRRARLEKRARSYDNRALAQERTAIEYAREVAERRAKRKGSSLSVREHGELGPLLVDGADKFTDHAAIAA